MVRQPICTVVGEMDSVSDSYEDVGSLQCRYVDSVCVLPVAIIENGVCVYKHDVFVSGCFISHEFREGLCTSFELCRLQWRWADPIDRPVTFAAESFHRGTDPLSVLWCPCVNIATDDGCVVGTDHEDRHLGIVFCHLIGYSRRPIASTVVVKSGPLFVIHVDLYDPGFGELTAECGADVARQRIAADPDFEWMVMVQRSGRIFGDDAFDNRSRGLR